MKPPFGPQLKRTLYSLFILTLLSSSLLTGCKQKPYEATPESLATHPIPDWWQQGKFGIFIHWGPYSVPGYGTTMPRLLTELTELPGYMAAEWYWVAQQVPLSPTWFYHLQTYGPNVTYDDFLPQFTAENFDADEWIHLFEQAGAKYFVLTSKHHDGFALWPSDTTGRDAGEIGAKRDLVGELFDAAERAGNRVKPGLYFSIPEFFHTAPMPQGLYENTGGNKFAFSRFIPAPRNAYTQVLLPYTGLPNVNDYGEDIVRPQFRELVTRYTPYLIWCDIGGDAAYFQSNQLIADYYNFAMDVRPEGVLVNNRCGDGNTHQDYLVVEQGSGFADTPNRNERTETARTMGESWGFDQNEAKPGAHVRSAQELVAGLVQAIAFNSNYLLNIGPKADGTIPQWQQDRLLAIGRWLKINGEAVYNTSLWDISGDEQGNFFTLGANGELYISATNINESALIVHADIPVNDSTVITLLGSDGTPLPFEKQDSALTIHLPEDLFSEPREEALFTQVLKVSSR